MLAYPGLTPWAKLCRRASRAPEWRCEAKEQRLTANDQREEPIHAAVWQAENEPVLDGGNPPRPIRHFRLAEHCTLDRNSSRVPVHSALVQKSVATNTNLADRLSEFDAREFRADAQEVAGKKMAGRLLRGKSEGRELLVSPATSF